MLFTLGALVRWCVGGLWCSGLSRGYMHLKKASTGRGHLLTLSTQRALWQKHLQFFSTGGLETVFKSERLRFPSSLPLIDVSVGRGRPALPHSHARSPARSLAASSGSSLFQSAWLQRHACEPACSVPHKATEWELALVRVV